jgi:HK97 family phage major capsid protein
MDYGDLIPASIAREVIQSVGERTSAVMRLARVVRMPVGTEVIPVVQAAPVSGWVDPSYGGLKPTSDIEWGLARLTAAELATILAIPNAFIDDAHFPVWESIRDEVARWFAETFDRTALYNGPGTPARFPSGGLVGAAETVSGSDALGALDAALWRVRSALAASSPGASAAGRPRASAARAARTRMRRSSSPPWSAS